MYRWMNNTFRFFDVNDSGDGGTDDSGNNDKKDAGKDPEPESEKKFTQKEVDAIMKKHRKGLQKENKELSDKLETLSVTVADLAKTKEPEKEPDTAEGKLELANKKHERLVKELEDKVVDLTTTAKAERKMRLEKERDVEISEALADASCTDATGGKRYVLPQVEYEEEEESWVFKTRSGNFVAIKDGVVEELPDYLRSAKVKGGSGNTGRGPRARAKATELETAKKKLEKLHENAKVSGKNDDMLRYQKQKRAVKQLEASAS